MAGLAVDSIEVMLGSVKLHLVPARRMAMETPGRIVRRIVAERKNQLPGCFDFCVVVSGVGHRLRVCFSGTMTRFTACTISDTRRCDPGVYGFRELFVLGGVTGSANFGSCKIFWLPVRRSPCDGEILVGSGLDLSDCKAQCSTYQNDWDYQTQSF